MHPIIIHLNSAADVSTLAADTADSVPQDTNQTLSGMPSNGSQSTGTCAPKCECV